jgi:hypothetical protein
MLRVTCRTPLLVLVLGLGLGLALAGCKRSALVPASDDRDAASDRGQDSRVADAPQTVDGTDASHDVLPETCTRNEECASGVCAQGTCCNARCDGTCLSCRLPGSIGTCAFVPINAADPGNRCPLSHLCDGRGGCIPPSCTRDVECGGTHFCIAGHCVPCSATCTSSAACVAPAVCITRNFCSYCGPADAGATD